MIDRVYHIDRGYEKIEAKLAGVGARIRENEHAMSTPHKSHNPGFLALVNDAKSRVKEVDIDQYQKMPREVTSLIDVREDNEWAAGHAAGAIHLSKGIIERDIETQGARQIDQDGAVLRRRIPLGAGGGCAAEDGLHERDFARRRMAGVE